MHRNHAGFTLIELMITIVIAAVLLVIAVPGFQDFIVNNRIVAQTNELVADLALARSEAIKRGAAVTVCAANDASGCDTAAGTNWTAGRLILVDANSNGTIDAGDVALRFSEAIRGNITLTVAGPDPDWRIQYLPSGIVDAGDDATFTLCQVNYNSSTVAIGVTGRTTTTKSALKAAAC